MVRVREVQGNNSEDVGKAVFDIMEGKVDAVWLRGFSDISVCEKISSNFYSTGDAQPRKDNVPGIMIGESHYFKSPENYYKVCGEQRKAVASLFEDIDQNPVQELYSIAQNYRGNMFRPATWCEHEALPTRAISWQEKPGSQFLLRPHDDVSQVFCSRNEGWETQHITTLVAVNFYARCQSGSGMLRVFDLKHSSELAEKFGVEGVGYPYPQDYLSNFDYIDIPVETGDVAMLNGAYVHSVTPSTSDRIVLNSFLGDLKNDNEIIYWT
ncbi:MULTISPECIES: hypothetical protein [unclassified Brenneria]|uniref:hypothetical protein n=1 Tax=unclassified Brenneria TaxID=2634434 RepID=UPI0018F08A42|nr:hypothetical protein [Brenneria sp. L3-3C-1]MBJ7220374.1 hypothetical protein [Brenneria sp. L3-3C-1]MEE3641618.1 hypothetical protein [Brenneria sp. L3_3C_1]